MNKELFEKGLKVRREVLGADYVDASLKNADDFNMPMQELVTQVKALGPNSARLKMVI